MSSVGASETRPVSSAVGPLDAGAFAPGTMLSDRYRIVSLAGRGGMGEVYRAEDLRLGQTVALKFLPAGLEHDPAARERLVAEVRSARTVSHANVCRVYDVGSDRSHPRTGAGAALHVAAADATRSRPAGAALSGKGTGRPPGHGARCGQ